MSAGRELEAVPAQVLPGGLAGDRERPGPRRRDLHHLALPQQGARAAAAGQLQSARPQERGELILQLLYGYSDSTALSAFTQGNRH